MIVYIYLDGMKEMTWERQSSMYFSKKRVVQAHLTYECLRKRDGDRAAEKLPAAEDLLVGIFFISHVQSSPLLQCYRNLFGCCVIRSVDFVSGP